MRSISTGVFQGMGMAKKALSETTSSSKVLQYLDRYKLGYLTKRKQLRAARTNLPPEPIDSAQEKVPFPFELKEKAKLLLRASTFEQLQDLPGAGTSEVAFIGRSNSGKSTLINGLLSLNASHMQHSKVSDTPGETKDLLFYGLGHRPKEAPSLLLCDMPGYGFAFMSEADNERCKQLIQTYLQKRGIALKRVCLLIDARYGFKPADVDFLKSITVPGQRTSWKIQVILTKCDIVERPMLARRVLHTREHLHELLQPVGGSKLPVLMVAAKQRNGLLPLQKELAALCPRHGSNSESNSKIVTDDRNSRNGDHGREQRESRSVTSDHGREQRESRSVTSNSQYSRSKSARPPVRNFRDRSEHSTQSHRNSRERRSSSVTYPHDRLNRAQDYPIKPNQRPNGRFNQSTYQRSSDFDDDLPTKFRESAPSFNRRARARPTSFEDDSNDNFDNDHKSASSTRNRRSKRAFDRRSPTNEFVENDFDVNHRESRSRPRNDVGRMSRGRTGRGRRTEETSPRPRQPKNRREEVAP